MTTRRRSRSESAVRLKSPTDVIAAVPYLLGFHPDNSIVAIGLTGKNIGFTGRCDLPPEGGLPSGIAVSLLQPLAQEKCREALLVGYGAAEQVTPCVDAVREVFGRFGIQLREAIRVTEGRYWSYNCVERQCCPPEGTAYDADTSIAPAALVAAGLSACSDRAALAATLAPIRGTARQAMRIATAAAEAQCRRRWGRLIPREASDHFGVQVAAASARDFTAEGVALVRRLAERVGTGDEPPTSFDEIAWLLVLLRSLRTRDEAWARIQQECLDAQLRLWIRMLRHAEPAYVAAPGCLAAFAAWQSGQGSLANVALERVEKAEPEYSLAGLLREAFSCGLAPHKWRHFTPEWLEEQCPVGER